VIRVVLPVHLKTLVGVDREVELEIQGVPTQRAVIDALETQYPALTGTLRDPVTQRRRKYVRFFAGEQDLSHEDPDAALPAAVASGVETYYIVGAMAGG